MTDETNSSFDDATPSQLCPPLAPPGPADPSGESTVAPTPAERLGDSLDRTTRSQDAYRSPRVLGAWLEALFVLVAVVASVAAASSLVQWQLIDRALDDPLRVTIEQLERSDDRQLALSVAHLVVLVGAYIVLAVWTRRVYRNAASAGVRDLRFSSGWAAGAWFVPVLSFIRPKQILDDVWRATGQPAPAREGAPVSPLLNVWWAIWVASALFARFGVGSIEDADVGELRGLAVRTVISDVLFVAAAVLAAAVVRSMTQRQATPHLRVPDLGTEPSVAPLPADPFAGSAVDSPRPPAPPDRRRSAGWRTGLALGAAAVAFGVGLAVMTESEPTIEAGGGDDPADVVLWDDLDSGDCIAEPQSDDDGLVAFVALMPCDEAHDYEVFAQTRIVGMSAAFPGDPAVIRYAEEHCLAAFEPYVGRAFERSGLDILYVFPSEGSWSNGDRLVTCALARLDGRPLTEAMRGSGV